MTRCGRARTVPLGAWAVCVAGAALVARMPGDPGTLPTSWLVVAALLGVGALRGSRAAWGVLVALNLILVLSFLQLARPIEAQLVSFYALSLLSLLSLLAVPVLEARERRTALAA